MKTDFEKLDASFAVMQELFPNIVDSRDAVFYPKAGISTVLCEEVNEILHSGPRDTAEIKEIFIVGGDGYYCHGENSKPWKDALILWSGAHGARVSYFVVEPTEEFRACARELTSENLKFFEADPQLSANSNDAYLLEQCRTHHFIVGSNPDFLWTEESHLPTSIVATNCRLAKCDKNSCDLDREIYLQNALRLKKIQKQIS
jgi:hypothetical protein